MDCYVLIGGHSRRMGQSKPELFLDRIVVAAQPVFDRLVAVQRAGGAAASIPTIFEEPHDGDGPVFGIQRALQDARGRCFVIAVDYPLVTSALLRFLAETAVDAPMVVPVWRARTQPLCAVYDRSVLRLIDERIAGGSRDVVGLIPLVAATIIAEQTLRERFEGEPLLNVNTPAELQEAEALYGK